MVGIFLLVSLAKPTNTFFPFFSPKRDTHLVEDLHFGSDSSDV